MIYNLRLAISTTVLACFFIAMIREHATRGANSLFGFQVHVTAHHLGSPGQEFKAGTQRKELRQKPNILSILTLAVLVRVSVAVKRHHDHGNSHKGKHLIGAGLQFRGSVHYYHDRT